MAMVDQAARPDGTDNLDQGNGRQAAGQEQMKRVLQSLVCSWTRVR